MELYNKNYINFDFFNNYSLKFVLDLKTRHLIILFLFYLIVSYGLNRVEWSLSQPDIDLMILGLGATIC